MIQLIVISQMSMNEFHSLRVHQQLEWILTEPKWMSDTTPLVHNDPSYRRAQVYSVHRLGLAHPFLNLPSWIFLTDLDQLKQGLSRLLQYCQGPDILIALLHPEAVPDTWNNHCRGGGTSPPLSLQPENRGLSEGPVPAVCKADRKNTPTPSGALPHPPLPPIPTGLQIISNGCSQLRVLLFLTVKVKYTFLPQVKIFPMLLSVISFPTSFIRGLFSCFA